MKMPVEEGEGERYTWEIYRVDLIIWLTMYDYQRKRRNSALCTANTN